MRRHRKLLARNPYYILKLLCASFGYRFDPLLYEELRDHPHFPGLVSYRYLLRKKGIESIIIKTSADELARLPSPVMVHTSLNGSTNFLVRNVEGGNIYVFNENLKEEPLDISFFTHYWDGYALVINPDSQFNARYSLTGRFLHGLGRLKPAIFSLTVLGLFIYFFITVSGRSIYNIGFMTAFLFGLAISVLLYIRQVDRNNPLVNSICHSKKGDKKIDCSSILDSKDASFMGLFTWTDMGLFFFLSLVVIALSLPGYGCDMLCSILATVAFPYTFYSVIYQWKIAGSWCRLCLMVQAALLLSFAVAVFFYINNPVIVTSRALTATLLPALLVFLSVFVLLYVIMPYITKGWQYPYMRSRYLWLKMHPNVMETLLGSEERSVDTAGIEKITINPEAVYRITVVINTNCAPCSREMKYLLEMIRYKENTGMDILFFLNREDSFSVEAARVLIYRYLTEKENIATYLRQFVDDYPSSAASIKGINIPEEYRRHADAMIDMHEQWCRRNDITSTPKIFINGNPLHFVYGHEDIDLMCT